MTNRKLAQYVDRVFLPYEDVEQVKELKEELLRDLEDRLADLRREGIDEEEAFQMTIGSIGDISELIDSIHDRDAMVQLQSKMNLSMSDLRHSDFRGVRMHDGQFNYSNLHGSDFSESDLTHSSFKCGNLQNALFHEANLTRAHFLKSNLVGAQFKDCIFNDTSFKSSDLSGVCFDNQRFEGTVFDYAGLRKTSFRNAVFRNVSFKTDVKKAIFDGAAMDKVTYALLKGYKADLSNVTII